MGSMERGVPVKILAMISDRSEMQAALPHLPQRIFRLTSAVMSGSPPVRPSSAGLFYQVSMWYLICSVYSFSVICPALPCRPYPLMLARSTSAHIFSLLPCFGPQDIAAITREDVKKGAYGLLDQGRSRSTVKAALAPLCEMFIHLRPAVCIAACRDNPGLTP